jgi:hypothetical protein
MPKSSMHFYGAFSIALFWLAGGAAHALSVETVNPNKISSKRPKPNTTINLVTEGIISPSPNPEANDAQSDPSISLNPVLPTSTGFQPVSTNHDSPAAANKAIASDALSILQNLNSNYHCSETKIDSSASPAQVHEAVGECLTAMEAKIATAPSSVSQEDLAQLKSLALAFQGAAGQLGDRVTKLENQVAQKPQDSFSTTTKLAGEAIVAISDVFGGGSKIGSTNTIFSNRVRLVLRTTFTGKDLLLTRLQARNSSSFSTGTSAGTNTVRLGFEGNEDNAEYLHLLQYQFPLGPNTRVVASLGDAENFFIAQKPVESEL